MSAFIVGADHIDAMLTSALAASGRDTLSWWTGSEWQQLTRANANEVGAMLIAECVASVSYRYHGESAETLPGPVDKAYINAYTYRPTPPIKTVDGFSIVACYEYQSCEHPAWETSSARRFCDSLRLALIRTLPGYGEATWEYTR